MTGRFTHHQQHGHTLHAWGAMDALEVSAPSEGVLRVRYAPSGRLTTLTFPRLQDKHSFAVTGAEPQPLHVHADQQALRVAAPGVSFTLDLTSGLWEVRDAQDVTLARAREVRGNPDSLLHQAGFSLDAPRGAAYLGFGEKVGPIDRRGWRYTFWNTDHFPYHTDSDPLYASIPFGTVVHEGRACGLFLDEPWRSEIDIANRDPQSLSWVSAGPELDLYVIAGPGIPDVLRRYTRLTGRHHLPPLWALGASQSRWGYENEDDVRAIIQGYRSRNLPLDAVYVDIDYMDAYKVFTWDPQRFPDPASLVREAAEQGVKLIPIVDPGVKKEAGYPVYEEAAANDYLVRTSRGGVLVGEVWPNPAVFPDFTRPEVVEWWARHFAQWAKVGIHGVWNDMNEPSNFSLKDTESQLGEIERSVGRVEGKTLPYDARHGKRKHLEVHNVYALGMNEAARKGLAAAFPDQRPFLVSRAGYAGLQRYGALWTGDNTSAWSHLALSIPMLTSLGLSGIAFCGADVGGFIGDTTGELLARWVQLGAFYPMMRNHSAMNTRNQEPWRFEDEIVDVVREGLELRYRLLPLLYTLMHEASESGLPPMRALALHHLDDEDALREDSEFLFGDGVLVAPVLRAGSRKRLAYLPQGRWLELPNLQAGGAIHEGRQYVVANADLHTLPAYLRAGSAIPLTEAAQRTSSANWASLTWHVHADARIEGRLYEDAGDGYGAARETTLRGTLDGGTLRLERETRGELPLAREQERVIVYGLSGVREVQGAREWRAEGGALALTLPADWREVTVTLAG